MLNRKIKFFTLFMILILLVISITGCGSSTKDETPSGIKQFFGTWKSADLDNEISFKVENSLLGKAEIEEENATIYYYRGTLTCEALGAITFSKMPTEAEPNFLAVISQSIDGEVGYTLTINSSNSENDSAFLTLAPTDANTLQGLVMVASTLKSDELNYIGAGSFIKQ